MEKPATNQYPIHDLLRQRWSPRAFAHRPVETDKLSSLFEAARWSASSYNEQPWRFIVATKDNAPDYERLLGCLMDLNQAWAKAAPVLVITVAKQFFDHNNKPNRVAIHDLGLAVANLTVQATALGLVLHQMGGVHLDKARAALSIPPGYDPVTAIAIGYPGDPGSLPAELRERELEPRERNPQAAFVFGGTWQRPVPWSQA
jgi:nitroreductase